MIKTIKIWFYLLKGNIQWRVAVREAEGKYKERNVRYYVIPNFEHKLITCNRREIHRYRTDGYFDQSAKMDDFKRECFYYTPYANGQDPISFRTRDIKRKEWLNYLLQAKGLV